MAEQSLRPRPSADRAWPLGPSAPGALGVSHSESSKAWFVQAACWKGQSLPGPASGGFQKLLPNHKYSAVWPVGSALILLASSSLPENHLVSLRRASLSTSTRPQRRDQQPGAAPDDWQAGEWVPMSPALLRSGLHFPTGSSRGPG